MSTESAEETYQYPGKEINVTWDKRLCIHMAECGRAQGDLFVGNRQPWCQPDLVSVEETIDVVERCPSGALTYQAKDESIRERVDQENTIMVTYNGPLFVHGDIDIEGAPDDMPGVAFRVALCRCGQSKTKPFCDNSHIEAHFQDYGAVGEKGEPLKSKGGKLSIKTLKNGPLLLSGNVTLKASSGRVAWEGNSVALCRCGASKNKPFCDGSHKEANFKSE
jgi:CDGSH-type Zn-finger protein/uncharacterized Fe-S cluster protein YjdI